VPIQTSHNGGTLQFNLGTLQGWGDYPYINFIKMSQTLSIGGTRSGFPGVPLPSDLNDYGYPQVNPQAWSGNYAANMRLPGRTGNLIIDWVGDITVQISGVSGGTSNVSGGSSSVTATGVNGRWEFSRATPTVPTVIDVLITRVNESVPFTDLRLYYAADESLLNAGEKFNPTLVQLLQDMGCGNIRSGNFLPMNEQAFSRAAYRKPQGYISSQALHFYKPIYAGYATAVGDAYSISLPTGVTFNDGEMLIVVFNDDATSFTDVTIDWGLGPVPLKGRYGGNFFSTERPAKDSSGRPRVALLFRDDELGCVCKWGGDGALSNHPIYQRMPHEDFLEFCATVGAHMWTPFCAWGLETASRDIVTQHMQLHKDWTEQNNCTWLKGYWETPNETWNTASSYPQTHYATAKGAARGWDQDDIVGSWAAKIGQDAETVYGASAKGVRYEVGVGVQTLNRSANTLKRVTSPAYEAAGGVAAHSKITFVTPATYFNPTYSLNDTLAAAVAYAAADAAGKSQIISDYLATAYVDGTTGREVFGIPNAIRAIQGYKENLADPYGLDICAYEGALSCVELTGVANLTATITGAGITKAAEAEIQIGSSIQGVGLFCPPVGMQISIAGVGGMTEMNGLTPTVTAVTASNKFKVNVDSTSFTTWTSGGTVTMPNAGALIKTFVLAAVAHPDAKQLNRDMFQRFTLAGGLWPSYLQLSGMESSTFAGGSQWRNLDTDIYETIDPKFPARRAAEEWNVEKPIKIRLTTS
jgi:hypothetical protein